MRRNTNNPARYTPPFEPAGSQVAVREPSAALIRDRRVVQSPDQAERPSAERRSQHVALAYLTTEYPKASHTFIRREILGLERSGQTVLRLAIRASEESIVDPADVAEHARTTHFLSEPRLTLLYSSLVALLSRPIAFVRAVAMTLRMARRSDRGFVRHAAYLVEATHLLRISQRERIRHVHVHFGTNAAAVARLAQRLGGPTYSLTIHGPDEFDAPQSLSLPAKIADALFVVAISDYGAAQIRRWVPYEQWRKIHIVHCTVDDSFFDSAQPIDPTSRTLVCVGRLTAQKGQFVLLDALAQIVQEGTDAQLVLAGDGELRPQIERRIIELELQDRVEITGWIDESEVRRRLLEARALILPSFAEGLPVVIMEAFALGRAVVSTTIAGIPELVAPKENGWLVPAGNVAELASAMRTVLEASAAQLDHMGRIGQERVRQSHRSATELPKLLDLFDHYVRSTSDEV